MQNNHFAPKPVRNSFGDVIKFPERFEIGERVISGGSLDEDPVFATVIQRFNFDYEGRQITRYVREDGEIRQGNARKLPGCPDHRGYSSYPFAPAEIGGYRYV
jgi:hypothetical protein